MLGHPLHPAIVHFPIALLLSATIADVAWLAGWTGDVHLGAVMMAGGLAAGLVAMAAGMVDFISLDEVIVPYALQHISAVGLAWIGYAAALSVALIILLVAVAAIQLRLLRAGESDLA